MTKREIVDLLVGEYGVEDKGLMRKTVKELEEILKEVEENKEKQNEGQENIQEEYIDEVQEDGEVEVIEEDEELQDSRPDEGFTVEGITSEVQLKIFETVVRRYSPSRNLRIENLGAGDIYVGTAKDGLVNENNKIVPGQGVGIPNVSDLYITSASRPVVRIIY